MFVRKVSLDLLGMLIPCGYLKWTGHRLQAKGSNENQNMPCNPVGSQFVLLEFVCSLKQRPKGKMQ